MNVRASLFALLLVAVVLTAARAAPPVARVQRIPLPGVEGRIDHMAVDPQGKRLFIAALGNNTVEVIDLAAGKRVRTLHGFHEPQGIAFAPGPRRLFIANGQTGQCAVYDAASYREQATVPFGSDADNVRCDAKANRVYVGYGAGAIGILDAATLKRVGSIRVPGHPESFQLERAGSRVFVNVPDAGQIAVVDRTKQAAVATWPVLGARSNFPMALDEAHHRLFVGCRTPARLLVYDTVTGKPVASYATVGDTDDVFYDAARKRIYVCGGEGYLDVFAQDSPDRCTRIQHVPTAPGARTAMFVPELSRIYVAVPHRGDQEAEVLVFTVTP
jgi:DNA-binding beta-propeller fold protein YncE